MLRILLVEGARGNERLSSGAFSPYCVTFEFKSIASGHVGVQCIILRRGTAMTYHDASLMKIYCRKCN